MCAFFFEDEANEIQYIIWSNYGDLTRPGPRNGGLLKEIPLFQGNLGW